jgi:hypothetical protein
MFYSCLTVEVKSENVIYVLKGGERMRMASRPNSTLYILQVNFMYIFRDEGEDGEKKRDWKDEKKSEELSGGDKDENEDDKEKDEKDKVCVCACTYMYI